jgi:hypothetical protein
MMKSAIAFVVNRLLVLAAVWMFVSAYGRDDCRGGVSHIGTFERALEGWRELQRALP